jgi:hypothetical protein
MGSVTRRRFVVGGSVGALGAAGVAAGVLGKGSGGASQPQGSSPPVTALTEEELERASIPMMLHVRDVKAGEVGVLVDEREIVFTDPALVATLLRATN